MEKEELNLVNKEVEELVISEIKNKTKLVLSKGDFKLDLKSRNTEISGDVFIYGEFYENFRAKIPKEKINEKICELVFTVISNFGDLKGVIISGKRNTLEGKLNVTSDKILYLIQNKSKAKEQLGEITIMVDEIYPYNEFYENNFPIWQYEIRDTTQKLKISERLDFDLNYFNEVNILNRVEIELNRILRNE